MGKLLHDEKKHGTYSWPVVGQEWAVPDIVELQYHHHSLWARLARADGLEGTYSSLLSKKLKFVNKNRFLILQLT